jgi:hypothetical protein
MWHHLTLLSVTDVFSRFSSIATFQKSATDECIQRDIVITALCSIRMSYEIIFEFLLAELLAYFEYFTCQVFQFAPPSSVAPTTG